MTELTLPIKIISKEYKLYIFSGITLTIVGISFSFILDTDSQFRWLLVGAPMIVGFLSTLILSVTAKLTDIGNLRFTSTYLHQKQDDLEQKILWTNIENIEVIIDGTSGDLRRSYIPFANGSLLPIELGHCNYIYIIEKSGKKINLQFYLKNRNQEKQLLDWIKKTCKNLNINLKIKN